MADSDPPHERADSGPSLSKADLDFDVLLCDSIAYEAIKHRRASGASSLRTNRLRQWQLGSSLYGEISTTAKLSVAQRPRNWKLNAELLTRSRLRNKYRRGSFREPAAAENAGLCREVYPGSPRRGRLL